MKLRNVCLLYYFSHNFFSYFVALKILIAIIHTIKFKKVEIIIHYFEYIMFIFYLHSVVCSYKVPQKENKYFFL